MTTPWSTSLRVVTNNARHYATRAKPTPRVWAITDGGLQATLSTLTLAKRLGETTVKTIVSNPSIRSLPLIIQKSLVNWGARARTTALPWYLRGDDLQDDAPPDYIVASGSSAVVPGCLHVTRALANAPFSVFLGYPNLPFIFFDQVVIHKHEANVKMAKLGPLAQQRNCLVTKLPLFSKPADVISNNARKFTDNLLKSAKNKEITAVVVGGHHTDCRWYTEHALQLADSIKRMTTHLNHQVLVIFTDRASDKNTAAILDTLASVNKDHPPSQAPIITWDTRQSDLTARENAEAYEQLLQQVSRVIVTADLDYLTAHAALMRKPVYVAFGGQCRGYLQQWQQWLREQRLTRRLRIDRQRRKNVKPDTDVYSYLGPHPPFADATKVLETPAIVDRVKQLVTDAFQEKHTGKRVSS
ncbi:mitochondrial fission ELM1-domain-containing protein [Gongronella butleri]|nr:mitochondrial fission ELM1-domain-containing protein [Gongronella butleri]